MKRKLLIVFIAAAMIALIASGTHAFYTREDTADNVISAGKVDFEIHEITDTGEAFPIEGVSVLPGDVISKIVKVENTGDHPIYLRVNLVKDVNDDLLTAEEQLKVDINTDYWLSGGDGYYYYKEAVAPGTETEPLFTEVNIDGVSVTNDYLGKTFYLHINGDAVQSENNAENVLEATGWPEDNAEEIISSDIIG